jgi:anti-sigma regulatory factor (Ser/Thr protein kinase)
MRPDAARWPVPCTAARLEQLRHDLARWLAALGWPAGDTEDLVLAVNEAVTNAVEHGCAQRCEGVTVSAATRLGPGVHRVEAAVRDCGSWDGGLCPERNRGFGMPMMRALTAELRFDRSANGTTAYLVSAWHPGEPD